MQEKLHEDTCRNQVTKHSTLACIRAEPILVLVYSLMWSLWSLTDVQKQMPSLLLARNELLRGSLFKVLSSLKLVLIKPTSSSALKLADCKP